MTFIDWLRTKFSGGAVPLSGTDLHAYADEYAVLAAAMTIEDLLVSEGSSFEDIPVIIG